jgi:diguanylate cyclase (GGDEF)-like protein
MARTSFTWDRVGPREEERLLAGRVAAVLWLTVLPMLAVSVVLPGAVGSPLLILLAVPSTLWGIACLLIPWRRVPTPLFFHVPAALALPYIGLLIAVTGAKHSAFDLTLLMLIGFCSYFFTPQAAIPYVLSSLIVLAFPLLYVSDPFESELLSRVWVATFVYAAVGGVIMVGKQQLVSLRDEARELSMRDSLTGLANRRALAELLREQAGGTRRDDSIGLLLIDLDNFKDANTLHGFPIGDSVLVMVGEALSSISRQGDTVARLGGDEFAIVGHGLTHESTEWLAERALEHVRDSCRSLDLDGLEITASAGWAVFPDDVASVEELMTVADLSLRAAKAGGKNRTHAPVVDLPQLAS